MRVTMSRVTPEAALRVVVQRAAEADPTDDAIKEWAMATLVGRAGELVVRIVERAESAELNERYRGGQGPTNVLAFPAELPDVPLGAETPPIGDLVICAPVVLAQAEEQGKAPEAHWAHMIVHGCLHLMGMDHRDGEEAAQMESRERGILAQFGVADPYA